KLERSKRPVPRATRRSPSGSGFPCTESDTTKPAPISLSSSVSSSTIVTDLNEVHGEGTSKLEREQAQCCYLCIMGCSSFTSLPAAAFGVSELPAAAEANLSASESAWSATT